MNDAGAAGVSRGRWNTKAEEVLKVAREAFASQHFNGPTVVREWRQ